MLGGVPLNGFAIRFNAAGLDLYGVQRIPPLAEHVETRLLEDGQGETSKPSWVRASAAIASRNLSKAELQLAGVCPPVGELQLLAINHAGIHGQTKLFCRDFGASRKAAVFFTSAETYVFLRMQLDSRLRLGSTSF